MGARPKPAKGVKTGNFVSEWFGHDVWPLVIADDSALADQQNERCPFISVAVGRTYDCIKAADKRERKTGVCAISSDSNGQRENWLACPHRILDKDFTVFREAINLLYHVADPTKVEIFSIEKLKLVANQTLPAAALTAGKRVFIFTATKLGGEIDLPETTESPGTKVDVSIIEITGVNAEGQPKEFGKHLFFEIQTADFHGSPLHAVESLEKLLKSSTQTPCFHTNLSSDVEICGTGVEGPNKSNVFKRTFYQTALKVSIAEANDCAGFVLAIPSSVWESWRKHLADPPLTPIPGSAKQKVIKGKTEDLDDRIKNGKSWIFVFDMDSSSLATPKPLSIEKMISVSTEALQEFAFDRTAENIIKHKVVDIYRTTFADRISAAWPKPPKAAGRSSKKK